MSTPRQRLPAGNVDLQGSGALSSSQLNGTMGSTAGALIPNGVTMIALMQFLFPSNIEHPESTGRLELFAMYGPVDDDGKLRGGIAGSHCHTDLELRQMISHVMREALYGLFHRPRATVEAMVEQLMPLALSHNYTEQEVKRLVTRGGVHIDRNGRMDFSELQDLILKNQKRRLDDLLKDGAPKQDKKKHHVPYQSKQASVLTQTLRKKKVNDPQATLNMEKRLHNYASLCAGLGDQNKQDQVVANTILCGRPQNCEGLGGVNDRWDRYCALRRAGRSSYVQARNTHRIVSDHDDGIADRHPGASSLVSVLAL